MKHAKLTFFLFLMIGVFPHPLFAAKTIICNGQYALCAYATCIPVPGEKGKALCTCEVKSGYSVGSKACQTKSTITPDGFQTLISRYYPVKQYISCHNHRTWANCYNSQCIINPDNASQAFCTCVTSKNKGDYMYSTNSCDAKGCESGMISSFLVKDSLHDTESLKKLPNYDKVSDSAPVLCSA